MDQYSHAQENEADHPSAQVLVINDEEATIDLITLGLKHDGFEVEAASDGEEVIVAAQRANPIFIILGWTSYPVYEPLASNGGNLLASLYESTRSCALCSLTESFSCVHT